MSVNSLVWFATRVWGSVARLKILRRRDRLVEFRETPAAPLPIADLDLRSGCGCPRCRGISYVNDREAALHAQADSRPPLGNWLKPTAAIIDLATFQSYDAFVKAVSHQSRGNDARMVKKARRLGYATRHIAPNSYAKSIALIKESRRRRSQGFVLNSLFKLSPGLGDTCKPFVAPICDTCWIIDWGVFGPSETGEVLRAFAQTRRSGNYVDLAQLIGHGDTLKDGVVKLLLFDIVAWMMESGDPKVAGIRYIHYGAIESGSKVTTQWRRYMQFTPHRMRVVARDPSPFPADFKGPRYLALNPDVADVGMDPRIHYALFGAHQGRPYKAGARRYQPEH